MWIATNLGFYSVVQKPGEDFLTVRARVEQDLIDLRCDCPELTEIAHTPAGDYEWRARVSHEAFGRALGRIAQAIHYDNFKDEVAATQSRERASIYARVWATLCDLRDLGRPRGRDKWGHVRDASGVPF